MTSRDPYEILEVSPAAPDDEIRSAYRRLAQLHHPDHNRGSAESARRFEEIQRAYAEVRDRREESSPRPSTADLDARLADLEGELRQARAARERARRAAREATTAGSKRPSDEDLGYVTTDDSLGKILGDARSELSDRLSETRDHPTAKRLAELIDELAAKFGAGPGR